MNDKVVIAILWTLVAVFLIGWLDAIYSLRRDQQDWSRIEQPATTTTSWTGRR